MFLLLECEEEIWEKHEHGLDAQGAINYLLLGSTRKNPTTTADRKREMAVLSLVSCCNNPKLSFSTKGNGIDAKQQNLAPFRCKHVKFVKNLATPLIAAMLVLSPLCNDPVSLAETVDIQKGASLFRQACIGCHDAGGNIIQPGATLFLKDLQRNAVDTEDEIYRVTYFGKGRMPGFGEKCTPRGQCTFGARLLDEDIKLLAQFVKSQADQGWPKIESTED